MSKFYAINDLEQYAIDMRIAIAHYLSPGTQEDLNEYITINQIIKVIHDHCHGYDVYNYPIINEQINEKIFDIVTVWIHNVGLSKLAGQDLLDCAWDNNLNEMIFWDKENQHTKVI
jgi:hypothetical protein